MSSQLDTIVIDGGATATKVYPFTERKLAGEPLRLPPSNYQLHGKAAVELIIREIRGQFPSSDFASLRIVSGFAGAGRSEDQNEVREIFVRKGFRVENLTITGDDELYLNCLGDNAIILIAGTGSKCRGKARDKHASAGGWGAAVGGGIGAREIGKLAIQYTLFAHEGSKPPTALRDIVCKEFGLSSPADVIRPLHSGDISHADVARLAPQVLRLANESDDPGASTISSQIKERACEMVSTVWSKLEKRPRVLGFSGGLIAGEEGVVLREEVFSFIRKQPEATSIEFRSQIIRDDTFAPLAARL